jgi:GNAT superfamily N-acetyltransferase
MYSDDLISIRTAEINDYDVLYQMMREFAEFQKTPERLTLTIEQLRLDKDVFKCLVAVTSTGRIIGFSTWFFAYYSWTGKAVYMDDLFVVESFRGKGIGSRLFLAVIELARQSGCRKVKWQVSKWNTSGITYYKKMGAFIDDIEINCDYTV